MNYLKDRSSYLIVFLGFFSVMFFALSLFFSTMQKINSKGEITQEAISIDKAEEMKRKIYEEASFGLSKDLVIYQVKENDSTWKIAEEYLGDGYRYVEIEASNDLEHNQGLVVGQMLFISQSDSVSFASVDLSDEAIIENEQSDIEFRIYTSTHTVEIGDSLWSIAYMQYGDSYMWEKLYLDNYALIGDNPGIIQPGMELVL